MGWRDVWEFISGAADTAKSYSGLLKTGIAGLSTYATWKDQQKKNQMQQDAYDDYMAQAEAAGHAARAAIDVNYTPMTVSGVPQTKGDVTDFTAVAAKGGLMSIPNKQRKRYARGPQIEEVMEIEDESITPYDLKMEEGVNIGEQVKYNTTNPREGAWNVWTSGGIDQEIYEFNFDIFFESGDWMDMLKGQVPVQGNMQMASGPDLSDSRNELAIQLFGKELKLLSEEEMDILEGEAQRQMQKFGVANGGIIGLRHGGRPGYAFGPGPVVDQETMAESITLPDGGEEVVTDSMTEIEGHTAGGGDRGWKAQMLAQDLVDEKYPGQDLDFYDLSHDEQMQIYTIALDMIDSGGNAKGGLPKRVRKDNGGIMNLGGLEKDYRTTGGFVPIGEYEKKDDVPARLSKNEFVMTADAVRAAGGGSINKGAQLMYDTMKHLEAQPTAKRMTA